MRHQTTSTHRVALSPPNWQTARNCWHWAREVQPDITPAELVPYLWQRFSTYSAKVESWGILKPFVRDDSPQLRAAVVESRRQAQQQRQQQAGEEQERQLAERAAELAREEAREEARRQQLVDNPGSCECGGRGLINGQPCCRCPRGDRARMAIKAGVRIGL